MTTAEYLHSCGLTIYFITEQAEGKVTASFLLGMSLRGQLVQPKEVVPWAVRGEARGVQSLQSQRQSTGEQQCELGLLHRVHRAGGSWGYPEHSRLAVCFERLGARASGPAISSLQLPTAKPPAVLKPFHRWDPR